MRLYRTCLAALAIAACSPDAPVAEAEAPVPIRAAKATAAGTASMIVVPGTVRLRREAELGFGTGGTIRAIHVDEGDNVRRGAVLAELDLTTVAANLDAAIADKARAAAELKRSRELIAKGAERVAEGVGQAEPVEGRNGQGMFLWRPVARGAPCAAWLRSVACPGAAGAARYR